MPLQIPAWCDALKTVKRDEAPESYHTWYLFSEAVIFASTTEACHTNFFYVECILTSLHLTGFFSRKLSFSLIQSTIV